MEKVNRSAQIVRFGVFEADLQTGELHKNGVKVPLQGQPFQVCALLLERSGELVTREELRQKVWPEDTFVDFEQALNTAVAKIRLALGDDADNPRFVETLPRRGYRFIGHVDEKGRFERLTAKARWISVGATLLVVLSGIGIWRFARNRPFVGPGYWAVDTSIFKNFRLSDRFRLQFRAEAFNVFNHTNFQLGGATGPTGINKLDRPQFGQAGGTFNPRQLQFGLKLSF
jgi:DNA-binding winged helix-turn-helix (wHTH) protein